MYWMQIQGHGRPYIKEDVIAMAQDVKSMWLNNGRRQIVCANRLIGNINNELMRLKAAGGIDQVLAQTFVTELGYRPKKALRTHELYPVILKSMRQASGLPPLPKVTLQPVSVTA
ncbi:MAG: hypothetical protein C3F02_04940 [Parcubacteria group bacterium]|nr:MAG: hypothetical protein C3F02_04940 [Parcubacteria group bacterium]